MYSIHIYIVIALKLVQQQITLKKGQDRLAMSTVFMLMVAHLLWGAI